MTAELHTAPATQNNPYHTQKQKQNLTLLTRTATNMRHTLRNLQPIL
jgi:hypothetical protein